VTARGPRPAPPASGARDPWRALRIAAALALVLSLGAIARAGLAVRRGTAEAAAPPPERGAGAPAASARLPLPVALPPLPAGLLARAAGARALEREPCPPNRALGAADDGDARCAEPRQAVEIHWDVYDP
jgi:hypothetical protein